MFLWDPRTELGYVPRYVHTNISIISTPIISTHIQVRLRAHLPRLVRQGEAERGGLSPGSLPVSQGAEVNLTNINPSNIRMCIASS